MTEKKKRLNKATVSSCKLQPHAPRVQRPAGCVRLGERRYALTCCRTARARPSQAATQTRQARGCQEFSFIWHSELYNTFTENHTFEFMYTLFPFPPLLAKHVTGNNPLHASYGASSADFGEHLRTGVVGSLSSPHHHHSNDRSNPLALLKAVTAFFPTALCSAVTKLASLTRIFGPLEHGSVAITSIYNHYLFLSLHLNSFKNAFFSLPFYHMQ